MPPQKIWGGGISRGERLGYRLATIIYALLNGEQPSLKELASRCGVSERTIQRDINQRLSFLPISLNSNRYHLKQTHSIKHNELFRFALSSGINTMYPDDDYLAASPSTQRVIGISHEKIDETIFKTLRQCVKQNISVNFIYKSKPRQANPYKLINIKGVWYLAAVEAAELKNFALGQIKELKTGDAFAPSEKIYKLIEKSASYPSQQECEVVLELSAKVSEYIFRKNIFPKQRILKRLDDGNILLEATMSFEADFAGLIRYWIPHIKILSPKHLRDKILNELKDYLDKEAEAN